MQYARTNLLADVDMADVVSIFRLTVARARNGGAKKQERKQAAWNEIANNSRKRTMKVFIVASLITCSIAVSSARAEERPVNVPEEVGLSLSAIDQATAEIRSAEDLKQFLSINKISPINNLPADIRDRFLKSLVFTEHGLASYSYTGFDKLDPVDTYNVLSLFGRQIDVAAIPGLKARNSLGESVLLASEVRLVASSSTGGSMLKHEPIPNSYCWVSTTGATSCNYEYGSNCNAACK